MTISTTDRKAGPFDGNDVTVAFPFTFKVFSTADLYVVKADTATGNETVLVLDSDFTVSLNADQDVNPGGTLTMLTAPATGTTLTITSDIDILQPVELTNMGGFYPTVINTALDRITMILQQVAESVARCVKFSVSTPSDEITEIPSDGRANKALGFDAVGTLTMLAMTTGTTLIDLAQSAGSALIGFIQAGVGAVLRTVQDKLRERVSVLDFDAVGDGVEDDTLAIQAAIDAYKRPGLDLSTEALAAAALADIPPVTIDFCGRTYLISDSLDFADLYNVKFKNGRLIADSGASWGAGADFMLYVAKPQVADIERDQKIRNVTFKNIHLDGKLTANGVYLENTYEVTFEGGSIIGWPNGGHGMLTSDRSASPVTKNTHLKVSKLTAGQKELAALIDSSVATSGTAVKIMTADFVLNTVTVYGADVGFHFDNFSNGQVSDCHSFVKTTQSCLTVGSNCTNIGFTNFYSDTGTVDIKSFAHLFVGGLFVASSQVKLYATTANENGRGLVFSGCKFGNNPTFHTEGIGTWDTTLALLFSSCRKTDETMVFGSGIDYPGDFALGLVAANVRWLKLDQNGHLIPNADITQDIGITATNRLRRVYTRSVYLGEGELLVREGPGTPEAAVVAPVGSMYLRNDGGAGTCLYIKESGTGNTGWVAK